MIEAMACGTPVIAYRRGSVPEVLDHGWTGWIVDDIAGACAAVADLDRLDRRHDPRAFRAALHRGADGQGLRSGV